MEAALNQSPTSLSVIDTLPLESWANKWGDEIYFEIPVAVQQEPEAREIMQVGELGYWPVGRAFCIFFGPTPISTDEQPRAYSPVNVLGKLLGKAEEFKNANEGDQVRVELVEKV